MRILLFAFMMMVIVPAFGQRNKKTDETETPVTVAEPAGVIYSLPRTGIRVYISATRTDFTPGPYAKYADQLLGITDAKTEQISKWSIGKVRMETFSEPDPSQVFKTNGLSASLIGLAPNGCLLTVNSSSEPTVVEKEVTNPVSVTTPPETFQFADLTDLPYYSQGDSANRFRTTRLTPEQKAAQVANRILDCRRMRYEMAAGFLDELPPDGKAYEESLAQLKKIENGYIQLFVGKSHESEFLFSFEFVPGISDSKGEVLCRFSEQKGILEKSDLTGKPVTLDVVKSGDLSSSYDKLASQLTPGDGGIQYRIPGTGEFRLSYELKTLATLRTQIAQFGATIPVPEPYLDGTYSIGFHPETGAIKNLVKVK